jgi:RNA polymerase sigma-70 factor (ECF subfamily)
VAALRRGDREVVAELVAGWSSPMLRIALLYVRERAVAEEVVQDAWMAVLEGVHRFEGRSSLKTWAFRILVNRAKSRAVRERRTIPFSAIEETASPVESDRFLPADDLWAGHWATAPRPPRPDEELLEAETRERLTRAIRRLPPAQRAVLTLRDVDGWSADEVCSVLELSDRNQRVLLHRARSGVRRALEPYLEGANP